MRYLPVLPEGPDPADGETRFRALFEDVSVGVALSAPDGRFVQVNPALRELLRDAGLDAEDGDLTDLARYLPPGSDESRAWRGALTDVQAGRVPVARAELAISRPGGAVARWVRVTSALVEFGGRAYLLSHLEETTGQRRAARRKGSLDGCAQVDEVAGPERFDERLAITRARAARSGVCAAVLVVGPDPLATPPADGPDGPSMPMPMPMPPLMPSRRWAGCSMRCFARRTPSSA